MQKIINDKKYDTETATLLFEEDNGLGVGEPYSFYQALYKKKTGEYFLFSISCAELGSKQYDWRPFVDENEVKKYCVDRFSVENYENIFGFVPE